ncbi:MAG: hypothetical protein K9I70_04830 [Chitinophagaceae bacterium]|nr:hypothetical protein [Chitinophagaceae bacterium]
MERDYIKIDGTQIILPLFQKYKNEPWVLSGKEVDDKIRSVFFSGKWGRLNYFSNTPKFGLKSGVVLDDFDELYFIVDNERHVGRKFKSLKEIKEIFHIHNSTSIKINYVWDNCYIRMTESEIQFLQEFLNIFSFKVDEEIEHINNKERLEKEKEKNRLESLKKSQTSLLQEFDKDGNGVVDVIEGVDDFMILFKKHQKKIIDVDKQYIQNFVKVSNYLKTKRQNIQDIFSSIKNTKNQLQLNENVGILKNQIHTYELLLFHSLNMIISIVEEDLIIFYEIYESFDKLNMFNSNWENEVAQQLKNIEDGFSELMHSIDSMERNIVSGLNQLTYVTQEGFSDLERSVTKELQSIDSSIKFNNLLTGISTYQLYKINKQTKPLLPK